MSEQVWTLLPSTTNAEEAMHWKLYRAFPNTSEYYKRLYDAVQRGVPIAYKPTQAWQSTAAHIGRSKASRAPNAQSIHRKKNDGRPPDTKKELLQPSKKKHEQTLITNYTVNNSERPESSVLLATPSYPWSQNSCWLDTSLELIFASITRDFMDYASGCQDIPKICGLKSLYEIMDKCRISELAPSDVISKARQTERDGFRKLLKKKGAIQSINEPESLLVWIGHLSKNEKPELAKKSYRSQAYFETLFVEVHECTGDSDTKGRHVEILGSPICRGPLVVSSMAYNDYEGDLSAWFTGFIAVLRDPVKADKYSFFITGHPPTFVTPNAPDHPAHGILRLSDRHSPPRVPIIASTTTTVRLRSRAAAHHAPLQTPPTRDGCTSHTTCTTKPTSQPPKAIQSTGGAGYRGCRVRGIDRGSSARHRSQMLGVFHAAEGSAASLARRPFPLALLARHIILDSRMPRLSIPPWSDTRSTATPDGRVATTTTPRHGAATPAMWGSVHCVRTRHVTLDGTTHAIPSQCLPSNSSRSNSTPPLHQQTAATRRPHALRR
ncbi:hypothetical protein BJ912DRAFT_1141396 [Pholiota molesta]|nr:hypothetical protein BJ912DRAFT_1141396 [Pholiota molesta]